MNMIEIDNHFVLRLASFILQTLLLKKSVNSRKLNKMFAQAKVQYIIPINTKRKCK